MRSDRIHHGPGVKVSLGTEWVGRRPASPLPSSIARCAGSTKSEARNPKHEARNTKRDLALGRRGRGMPLVPPLRKGEVAKRGGNPGWAVPTGRWRGKSETRRAGNTKHEARNTKRGIRPREREQIPPHLPLRKGGTGRGLLRGKPLERGMRSGEATRWRGKYETGSMEDWKDGMIGGRLDGRGTRRRLAGKRSRNRD